MSAAPPDLPVQYYEGAGGAVLAYRETGAGRPVMLVHGFFSTGYVNWIRYGHASLLAERGYRVIMPDLRAHGESAAPHDAESYPPDVLCDDVQALVHQLGLSDFDLGGYSLGAVTVVRMLARGVTPGRAIVCGMGLEGMTDGHSGEAFFRRVLTRFGTFKHGDPEFMSQAFLKTTGGDPEALVHVLDARVDTPRDAIARIDVPTAVVLGTEDDDHGSGRDLAELLPQGRYVTIPGSHMGAVARPELGEAIADFLGDPGER
jgi:pimeloyl-ACP methyl ester carboxylesterase